MARRADVGIRDGRVFEIDGWFAGPKRSTRRSTRVSPDSSTSIPLDAQVLGTSPRAVESLCVTSVVAGNCYSIAPTASATAPLPRTLDKVEDMRLRPSRPSVSWDFESYASTST